MVVVDTEKVALHGWQYQEVEQIEQNIDENKRQFQPCKLDRLLFIAEIGKRYGLERVECHDNCHRHHPRLMVGIAEG